MFNNRYQWSGVSGQETVYATLSPETSHLMPDKGFSLIEALIATAIVGIAFVGVYSLVVLSEQFTKWAVARQKLQLVANQIFEVIDGDVANITNYNLDLGNCVDPGASTTTSLVRSYEWCMRMQSELFAAGATNVRTITVTASGTSYVVLVRLEAYGARAQIITERVYGS